MDYIGQETQLRHEDIFSEENNGACFNDFYHSIDNDKKRNNEILSSLSNNKEKDNFEYKRNNNKKHKFFRIMRIKIQTLFWLISILII